MKITIETNIDQDVGIEAMYALAKSAAPIEVFAHSLVQDFLNNLQPRVLVQEREALKKALDTASDATIAAIKLTVAANVEPLEP
jgi:hypothetical protein